jgi:hypothetical protein
VVTATSPKFHLTTTDARVASVVVK